MDDNVKILKQLLEWRSDGDGVALATVIKTWGSAPRRAGSSMCINSQMKFQGSVSGGCVETAVIQQALEVIESGHNRLLQFGVSDETAFEVGLACGGTIEIYVQGICDHKGEQITELIELSERNESAVLTFDLDDRGLFEVTQKDLIKDASGLESGDQERLYGALKQDRAHDFEKNGQRFFIQPCNPPLTLYIVGAVHITQELVPIIKPLGFKVSVVDPRAAFATEQRFPAVKLITRWPQQVFAQTNLNHRTAVITLTHDPKFDDPALIAALRSPAFYIGALGSRKTHARRLQRLMTEGFSEAQLSRIHAPIGLDIRASNPAEIAVSIAAELVQQLRKNEG